MSTNEMTDLRNINAARLGWRDYHLHLVEVISFQLYAQGSPNTLKAILMGLLGRDGYRMWTAGEYSTIRKIETEGLDFFWFDYQRPKAESLVKVVTPSHWSTPPTEEDFPSKEQLIEAVELGRIRYERAMSQPLPGTWFGQYEAPTDAFLARSPEYIIGGQMGYLTPFFWMKNPSTTKRYLGGERVLRIEFDIIGFGIGTSKEEGVIAYHPGQSRKEKDWKSWNSVGINIPTPQQFYEWVKNGGTAKSYIESQFDKIWES